MFDVDRSATSSGCDVDEARDHDEVVFAPVFDVGVRQLTFQDQLAAEVVGEMFVDRGDVIHVVRHSSQRVHSHHGSPIVRPSVRKRAGWARPAAFDITRCWSACR